MRGNEGNNGYWRDGDNQDHRVVVLVVDVVDVVLEVVDVVVVDVAGRVVE